MLLHSFLAGDTYTTPIHQETIFNFHMNYMMDFLQTKGILEYGGEFSHELHDGFASDQGTPGIMW